MRITNDCAPDAMLAELFCANIVRSHETSVFADRLWANHDEVCDQLKDRIDALLQSYTRLGAEVHVTQNMRDNGVDLLFEFSETNGGNRRIGIQVKSNNEAINATKPKRTGESMEAILKRQAYESCRWGLSEWWVVLCFDLTVKEHAKLVKRINAELLQKSPVAIRVYEPTNAWSILGMDEDEVDAMCVLALCKEDEVLTKAMSEVSELSPAAVNFIMETLFDSFAGETKNYSLDDLMELTSDDSIYDISVASAVIDELDDYLSCADYEDIWNVNPYCFPGLCALYFEGRVRHQLSHAGSKNFVRKLMTAV